MLVEGLMTPTVETVHWRRAGRREREGEGERERGERDSDIRTFC